MEPKSLSQWKAELKAELKSDLEARLQELEQSVKSVQSQLTQLSSSLKANRVPPHHHGDYHGVAEK